jgi:hypothetical protein
LQRDEHGRRRIDDPTDYVRREIAEVLRRKALVVPVLVGDAVLPERTDLPMDLRGLPLRQYRTVRLRDAEQDVERLADELVSILAGAPETPSDRRAEPVDAPATVSNTFSGEVSAPNSVFGIAYGVGSSGS